MKLLLSLLLWILLPLGFAYSQQHVFATSSSNSIFNEGHNILSSIDLSNCISRYIDTLPVGVFTIACTPNGKLWAMSNEDSLGGALYQLDTSTGNLAFAGNFDENYYYVQSMCGLNDDVLLIQCDSNLYGVTTTNVHSFRVGSIGYHSYCDMTWLKQDLFIMCYAGTNMDSLFLVKVSFNNGSYPPIANAAPVGNTSSLPRCYGLATIVLPGMDTALIGFADSNTYIINPADGSYSLYCSILPDSLGHFADATSGSYPSVPIIIDTVNSNPTGVINPLGNELNVKLYPNPVRDNLFINFHYPHAEFALTDIAGRVILRAALKNGLNEISMRLLRPGLYLGVIQMEGNIIYRRKILKE